MSEITIVEEERLLALHEMAGTCAVKGPLLREIIDELLALRRSHAELVRDARRYRWLKTRINWDDVAEQSGELISHYRSWEHRDYRESPPDSEHIDEYVDAALPKDSP